MDNLSGSDGTFEDPFATLLEAQHASHIGDFIYVFPGDGTTKGMDVGFIMKQKQTLAGSGASLAVSTRKGVVFVPALTNNRPVMTNKIGVGVRIRKNCALSGIIVNGAISHGFLQEELLRESPTTTLNRCLSVNNGGDGLRFKTLGTGEIRATISNCQLLTNGFDGFHFETEGASKMTAVLSNCSANDNQEAGIYVPVQDLSIMSVTFSNCSANNNGTRGIHIEASDASKTTAVLSNCSFSDNQEAELHFDTSDSSEIISSFSFCSSPKSVKL